MQNGKADVPPGLQPTVDWVNGVFEHRDRTPIFSSKVGSGSGRDNVLYELHTTVNGARRMGEFGSTWRCLVGGFVHDNPDEVIATQMEDKLWDIKAQGASRLLGSKCCKDQNVVRRNNERTKSYVDLLDYKTKWQERMEAQIVENAAGLRDDRSFTFHHSVSFHFRDKQGRTWSCDKEERFCIADNGAFFHRAEVCTNFLPVCSRAHAIVSHLNTVVDRMTEVYRSGNMGTHPNPVVRAFSASLEMHKSATERLETPTVKAEASMHPAEGSGDSSAVCPSSPAGVSSGSDVPVVLATTVQSAGFFEVEPKGNQKENAQNMKSDIKGLLDTDLFDMDDID